jgi:hypothetical protein
MLPKLGKPSPELKVGLVAYRDKNDAYVTQVHDLTGDLVLHCEDVLDRPVVVSGAANAESRHAVEKKIRPMLDSESDNRVGLRCGEHLAELSVIP